MCCVNVNALIKPPTQKLCQKGSVGIAWFRRKQGTLPEKVRKSNYCKDLDQHVRCELIITK